jgi:hypothetical protein
MVNTQICEASNHLRVAQLRVPLARAFGKALEGNIPVEEGSRETRTFDREAARSGEASQTQARQRYTRFSEGADSAPSGPALEGEGGRRLISDAAMGTPFLMNHQERGTRY